MRAPVSSKNRSAFQPKRKKISRAGTQSGGGIPREYRLEIDIFSSTEVEETASGEITNPNEEIPVTYLFYELQRRYEISERIHKVRPVILVANEIPDPNDINEDWLVRHAWILQRVLLDDTFIPALEAVTTDLMGAEFRVELLRGNVERQKRMVDDLREQLRLKTKQAGARFEDIKEAMENQESSSRRADSDGFFENLGEALFGGGREAPDADRMRAERARMALDEVQEERRELLTRLTLK